MKDNEEEDDDADDKHVFIFFYTSRSCLPRVRTLQNFFIQVISPFFPIHINVIYKYKFGTPVLICRLDSITPSPAAYHQPWLPPLQTLFLGLAHLCSLRREPRVGRSLLARQPPGNGWIR